MTNIIESHAKINLYLQVTGKKDGYHLLESIFAPISLADTIYIKESKENEDKCLITTKYTSPSPTIQNNTVLKALDLMRQKYEFKQYFSIEIEKQIPIGAGLGGGSSNAGAIISWLIKTLNLAILPEETLEIAQKIGADVPFFLYNKPALVKGIGEIIEPIELDSYKIIIVYPMIALSTKEVFAHYSAQNIASLEDFLSKLENNNPKEQIHNSLLSSACALCPAIEHILNFMKTLPNCFVSSMTGSGSTCFAIFAPNEDLTKQLHMLKTQYPSYFIIESNILI